MNKYLPGVSFTAGQLFAGHEMSIDKNPLERESL